MSKHLMTVLVVGAGNTGVQVLRQLLKNPTLRILTLDPRENPYAVEQGIIENVDFKESLTPLNLDQVLNQAKPDIILLTSIGEDMGFGSAAGVNMFRDALRDEIATISDVPVIEVARSTAR
jgi:hypothetical protein